jgi:hypothetical protein
MVIEAAHLIKDFGIRKIHKVPKATARLKLWPLSGNTARVRGVVFTAVKCKI